MKKSVFCLIVFFMSLLSFGGCTKNTREDVYFIHAVAFDEENDNLRLWTVIEKQIGKDNGENDGDFFVSSSTGKTLSECEKDLQKKFGNSYFAASELYLFSEQLSPEKLLHITEEICNSSTLPSKSRAVYLTSVGVIEFLGSLKTQDDLKKVLSKSDAKKHSFIRFSKSVNDKGTSIQIPSFSLKSEGNAEFTGLRSFDSKSKEEIHN